MDYNHVSFYEGGNYPLDSKYGLAVNRAYRQPAGGFSLALDPRTSNQLKEASNKTNTGAKQLEIQGVFSKQLDAIPDQHLDEIRRQAELTGVKLSLHGPLEEPSGFNSQGNRWDEANRQQIERQFIRTLERSHKLDPNGNIVVTFHSTAQLPELLQREKKDGKEVQTSFFVVDSINGGVKQINNRERYFPQNKEDKPYSFNPQTEVETINKETWDDALNNFNHHLDLAESRYNRDTSPVGKIQQAVDEGKLTEEDVIKSHPHHAEKIDFSGVRSRAAEVYLRTSYNELKQLYEIAAKSAQDNKYPGREEDLKKLDDFRKKVVDNYENLQKNDKETLRKISEEGLEVFKKITTPKLYKPFQEFVIEKSAETFGNAALNSFKQFRENSPIISIENPPGGGGLSRAEDIKALIEKSRDNFAKKAVSELGLTKSEAKEAAEKIIGATWDVGHINMIKKYGYDDKDLLGQAKTIKPFLKHIHLSDNFGHEHTELPMGMGNVPLKGTMEVFGDKFKKLTKVIETGDWYQHFQTSPLIDEFSAFGAPVTTNYDGASWNTAYANMGRYYAGYGSSNPDIHHSVWGRGFSALPQELGGQMPGKDRSRTTDTPLA